MLTGALTGATVDGGVLDGPASLWLWAFTAFILGGLVKGTLGVGLPLVAVPMLSLAMPTPWAMGLLAFPVLASNLWQAIDAKPTRADLLRFTPMFATLMVAIAATVSLSAAMSARELNMAMSGVIVLAVILMASNPTLSVPPGRERIIGAIVGTLAGAIGGVSSLSGPIMIMYLVSLRIGRERFVGMISIAYLLAGIPLYIGMVLIGRLGWTQFLLSIVAMVPIFIGMRLGKALRGRISELWFRRALLAVLLVTAAVLFFK